MKRHLLVLSIVLGALLVLIGAPGAQTVIEGFEDGNIDEYSVIGGTAGVDARVTAAAAHDGSYGLEMHGIPGDVDWDEGWLYRDDAQVHNQQGDVSSFWVQVNRLDLGRASCGFGATAAGCYSIVMAPNTAEFMIYLDVGYGYSTLATMSFPNWQANHWYRLEADWQAGGLIIATVYDSDGVTPLGEISATDNTYTQGGLAFRYWYENAVGMAYFDTITLGGVTPVDDSSWGEVKSLFR
jgi:hypothetical protein